MKPIYLGMKARLIDGAECRVTDVLIDPRDGDEHYIALSANGFFGPDVIAPLSAVWHIDDCVHLALSTADVAALQHVTPAARDREDGLRSCAGVRHGAHWPYRAGAHYLR